MPVLVLVITAVMGIVWIVWRSLRRTDQSNSPSLLGLQHTSPERPDEPSSSSASSGEFRADVRITTLVLNEDGVIAKRTEEDVDSTDDEGGPSSGSETVATVRAERLSRVYPPGRPERS